MDRAARDFLDRRHIPHPAAIAALGPARINKAIAVGSPRIAARLTGQILTPMSEQTVVIPATEQYGQVIRGLASQLLSVLAQRKALTAQLEELLATHPLAEILTSMHGVGPRTAIELLRTVGDGSTFASAAHGASYAGLALATRPGAASKENSRRGAKSQMRRMDPAFTEKSLGCTTFRDFVESRSDKVVSKQHANGQLTVRLA